MGSRSKFLAAKRFRERKIVAIVNDTADLDLARHAGVVIANNPPKNLKKYADIIINNNYKRLIKWL